MGDVVIFLATLALGLVLVPAARRVGLALGVVDDGGDPLKIHAQPVPLLGGPAVLLGAFAALWVAGFRSSPAIVAAVILALVTGMIDDVRPLAPRTRVLLLAPAGVLLAAGGLRFPFVGPALGIVGAVLLGLACVNAVNLIDGQDGLAGGLSAIAAVGLAARLGHGPLAMLGLGLAGGLAAFLLWNRPPARIFLGDGGAYASGIVLTALALGVAHRFGWRGLLAAGLCLGMFAFELSLTVVRRAVLRTGLAQGDRFHSYDILARRAGGRRRPVTLRFWAVGAALSGIAQVVVVLPPPAALALVLALSVCAALAGRAFIVAAATERVPR